MATVKFRLNVSSSTVGPDKVDYAVEKLVSVTEPLLNMAKVSVGAGSDTVILADTNVQSYVYLRNTDTTNSVTVKNTANNTLAILRAGEFALFPLAASAGLELVSSAGTCICEYGHWAVG
jgi:hypothetical protein